MPAIETNIGRNLKLFHLRDDRAKDLIITAHGIHVYGNFIVPPNTILNFYAPRNEFLVMPAENFRLGTKVEESLTSGESCPNYLLTKYQGAHGGGNEDNYESLQGKIVRTDMNIRTFDRRLNNIPRGAYPTEEAVAGRKREITENNKNLFKVDYLTIRNRNKFNPVTFKKVLKELDKHGYHYSNIFCSFCRGRLHRAGDNVSMVMDNKMGRFIGTKMKNKFGQDPDYHAQNY